MPDPELDLTTRINAWDSWRRQALDDTDDPRRLRSLIADARSLIAELAEQLNLTTTVTRDLPTLARTALVNRYGLPPAVVDALDISTVVAAVVLDAIPELDDDDEAEAPELAHEPVTLHFDLLSVDPEGPPDPFARFAIEQPDIASGMIAVTRDAWHAAGRPRTIRATMVD